MNGADVPGAPRRYLNLYRDPIHGRYVPDLVATIAGKPGIYRWIAVEYPNARLAERAALGLTAHGWIEVSIRESWQVGVSTGYRTPGPYRVDALRPTTVRRGRP